MSPGKPKDVTVTFKINGLSTELQVLGFRGDEGISRLFRFDIDLAVDEKKPVDFSMAIGKAGCLTLENESGKRYIHGMVCRLQQTQMDRNWIVYNLTLVPKAWRLQHRRDSRIFTKQRLNEIVTTVLQKHQIKNQIRLKGNKKPPRREYTVQYRETDWSFVCRLLEEEGFHYYFEHKQDDHVLHISNDATYHPNISGSSTTLGYMPPGTTPKNEHIFRLTYEERVRSGQVMLNDFTFLNSTLDNRGKKPAQLDTDLEVYDFPGLMPYPEEEEKGSPEVDIKKKFAASMPEMRLQAIQAGRAVAQGGSDCIRFTSGYAFTLDKLNLHGALKQGDYLLTQVSHSGQKHGDLEGGAVSRRVRYSNNFTIIPKATPFRPPRITPKPFVQGAQSATVVGTTGSNDDIVTDKHGRVRVRFHWDRRQEKNEKSSRWVRVSQLWAGKGWGAMYIPRVGHEVIVEFLEGDPDKPVIIGRVYNGQNTPHHTLPTNRTMSYIRSDSSIGGGGYNEICFEDKKDQEQIITHAQKDQNETVRRNLTTTVGGQQTLTVKKNRECTVHEQRWTTIKGDYDSSLVEGNQDYTVNGPGGAALHILNHYGIDAGKGIDILGEVEGVKIEGTGKGVQVEGKDKGVKIKGTTEGVNIHGKGRGVSIKGDASVLIDSKKVNIQSGVITVSGTGVTITAGGATVKVGAEGIKVDGAGKLVQISGSVVKINP